jgi:predicted dehydrogenase
MLNRRAFLTGAAGVAAAAASSDPAASDQVVVGFIGTGGRANRHLIPSFRLYDSVRVAALCDVYKPNLEQAVALAGGKVDTYGDYRRVLDRKDIDVVVVATPDHWHCPMVIEACQAGKDVYVEKPLSNEIDPCLKAVAAARGHNRVVQVGLQQRSSAPFLEAYKIFQSGVLGKVRHVVIINPGGAARPGGGRRPPQEASAPPPDLDWEMFQGPAPRHPYSLQRQQNWRSYWEYGCGALSDWGVHLLDVAHWYLGVAAPTHSAAAVYGWLNHPQDERLPDTIDVSWQYPAFVANYSSRSDVIGTYLWGDEGVLFVNRYGYAVRPVSGSGRGGKPPFEAKEVALRDEFPPSKPALESDEAKHIRNFLDCVKSRQRPVADIEIGSVSTIPTLMGGMSIRNGARTIVWNGHGAAPAQI